MKEVFAWIGGAILVVAVFIGLLVGGQRLGWWMQTYNVNKGAEVYQQGYGAQTAFAQQLNNLISQVAAIDVQIASPQTQNNEKDALVSQKAAVLTRACDIYQQITHPSKAAELFAATNCEAT